MKSPTPEPASPVAQALQIFNLLPSRTLHPQRARLLWPEDAAHEALLAQPSLQRALHRRRSEQLLQSLGANAAPVLDIQTPGMQLALAEPQLLAQLARLSGVLLLGSHLRRIITRTQVMQAREALGAEVFAWAQGEAQDIHAGMKDEQLNPWLGDDLNACAQVLGTGLLSQALNDAPPPVRLRAHWKLQTAADDQALRGASGLPARAAHDLCVTLMRQLDSTWHSYFHATR